MTQLPDEVLLKAVQAVTECGSSRAAGRKLGVDEGTVRRRLIAARERGLTYVGGSLRPQTRPKRNNGFTRQEFRNQYDVDTKCREAIRRAIGLLTEDVIVRDVDFRTQYCEVNYTQGWKQIIEEAEFLKYQFFCDGKIWWTHPETVSWVCSNVTKARPVE